ncbi:hypothetical protein Q4540_07545 [Pseudoalteromonas carrageenovora]|uniref:hypothetical protein n=1 Tax=Pseudoalteromonas carrageenovora TaxID=227 RepID=UPI0026E26F5C|nr:hypothetical protein [Pseudoalteromonas carrageenovora]MDO6634710.1 hypothetical protein [Pseudoalteromonas carrageenovora]MDO6648345.1 hypothetical protein [Pseudoalteromonas carrageenovora]MDO6834101.1 hypothetical protein [Pseudoalteromonas carrageenovora]
MNKNSLLTLGIGFIAGVGLTWGYFNFTPNNLEPVKLQQSNALLQKTHAQQPKSSKVVANKVIPAVTEQAVSLEQNENITSTAFEPQEIDELPLEEQVVQLKQQLAEQKSTLKSVLKQMRGPSDFEQVLRDKFDEQVRDEEWAYRTEMALQDFLLTADLAIIPDVVSAKCKTTVCEFELAAPADNDAFGSAQWRELNDKLMKQEFWKQFVSSTSTSSDTKLSLLLSTEL